MHASKIQMIFTSPVEGSYCTGLMKMQKKNKAELSNAMNTKFRVDRFFMLRKLAS